MADGQLWRLRVAHLPRRAPRAPGDAVARLLRHRGLLGCLWAMVAVCLVLRAWQGLRNGFDFLVVFDAARALLAGGNPYADPKFLYLPSSALLTVPVALLPRSVALVLATAGCLAAVVVVCRSSVRHFVDDAPAWLLPVVLLVVLVSPAGGALTVSANTEFLLLAALPLLYRWAAAERWTQFGLLLGLTLAVKPLLLALLLLPLLARAWRAAAIAVVLPAVTSLLGLLVAPGGIGLAPVALQRFTEGSPTPVSPWMEVSLAGVLRNTSVDPAWIVVARAAVLATGVAAAVVRWRRGDEGVARTVHVGSLLVLTSIVGAPLAWDHYAVLLVPLIVGAVGARSDVRYRRTVLLCLLPLAVLWLPNLHPARVPFGYGFRAGVALFVLFVVLCTETVLASRSRRSGPEPPRVA